MRTTVRLDPALMRAAKQLARSQNLSLTALIEHSLRQALETSRVPPPRFSLGLVLRPLSPREGIDFADRRVLYDAMDEINFGSRARPVQASSVTCL